MPKPIPCHACSHCGQLFMSRAECAEHEAECLWSPRLDLYDPRVHGCLCCGNLERTDGMYCAAKGGALVTVPVTLCRWWTPIPKPAPAPAGQACNLPAPPRPSQDVNPLAINPVTVEGL